MTKHSATKSEGDAIIVTGTPGTGKTNFAKKLAEEIGGKYISLTQYVSRQKLYTAVDRERRTKIIDIKKTSASLRELLSTMRRPVVIETNIPDGILPRQRPRQVFVLRCHPRIMEGRLRRKKWDAMKIRENVLAEILDACLLNALEYYGSDKIMQLDASRMSLKECLGTARRILSGRKTKRVISIDWIRTLEREGILHRYLR